MQNDDEIRKYARTALIVGGTSGVGLASAKALARQGMERIILVGRDADRGAKACDEVTELGALTRFLVGDASNASVVSKLVSSALEFLGSIDVVVNAVPANGVLAPVEQQQGPDIKELLNALALPPMLVTAAVLPAMRQQRFGSIINIASDAAKVPTPGEAVAGACMAAIVMFSRTAALEAKRHHVRVNVLTPSLILNTGTIQKIAQQEFATKIFDRIVEKAHLGVPTAEEVAETVAFLAGSSAQKITGQVISVNGGIST